MNSRHGKGYSESWLYSYNNKPHKLKKDLKKIWNESTDEAAQDIYNSWYGYTYDNWLGDYQ